MTVVRLAPHVLAVIGLSATAASLQMTIWSYGIPHSGFFPFVASVLLVITSLACRLDTPDEVQSPQIGRLAAYLGLIILYCVLLGTIGFPISTLMFLLVVFRAIEGMGWTQTIMLAGTFAFCTWLLFDVMLAVPLPKSAWGF